MAEQVTSLKKGRLPFPVRFEFRGRDWLWIGCIVVLVTGLVLFNGRRASEGLLGRPLRVGIVAWPGYAGGLVANNGLSRNKDSIFWVRHRLLVEFVPVADEKELWRLFARGGSDGGLDVIWATVDSLAHWPVEYSGLRPRAFVQVDWSRGGDAIVARAEIPRIEDLKGKQVAVSNAASQWLLEDSLANSSLTPADVDSIRNQRKPTGGSRQALELFVNGDVDAAVLWEPDVTNACLQRPGAHVIIDTSGATKLIADVMVADERFIRANRKVIAAFIRGWFDGTAQAVNDPMAAVKILREQPEFDELREDNKVHRLLGTVKLATMDDNVEMFGLADGKPFFDDLFRLAGNIWHQAYNAPLLNPEKTRDATFLAEMYTASESQRNACGTKALTKEILIAFQAGDSKLVDDARRALDQQISLLPRTHSNVLFSVRAVGDGADLGAARADTVIDYLVARYGLRRSQFVSAHVKADAAEDRRSTQCIGLTLLSAPAPAGAGGAGGKG